MTSTEDNSKWITNKDARNWVLLRQAHEGMMMDKFDRQNRIVEDHVKGMLSQNDINTSTKNNDGEDDMGVNIGNETNHHYHQQQQKSASALPLSILAAGALTGAGLLFNGRETETKVNVDPPNVPRQEMDIGLGFGQPEPISKEKLQQLKQPRE